MVIYRAELSKLVKNGAFVVLIYVNIRIKRLHSVAGPDTDATQAGPLIFNIFHRKKRPGSSVAAVATLLPGCFQGLYF